MEVRHSVCALDCPDCCSLLVHIENGKATKLRGNPDHPVTRGFLCAKVTQYLEREYHPDRLLHPMRRTGPKGAGQFERITWDRALDTIAANLKRVAADYGSESILPYSYAGTMGYLNTRGMDRRFFHRLGASRLDRTICSMAGMVGANDAYGGLRYGTEPEQYPNAKLIIAWGANILGTNVHYWPFIQEARRNGAKFYVIDPVRNRTGKLADKFYGICPGSDLALALGLMHVIFAERLEDAEYTSAHTTGIDDLRRKAADYPPDRVAALTGIPKDDIVQLAREYATTRPALIRANLGVQRSDRGATTVRAIYYLPVLTGAWKDLGGGLTLSTSQAFQINGDALERPDLQMTALGRPGRLVNMSELGSALNTLDNPRVHAMVVYNSNPAAVAPDQNLVRKGLAREDLFTVVLEQFQTDTADYADIVLPATTFLEHTDAYYAYGHYYLQYARPALPAPGEAKSNVEAFRLLAQRMGFDEPCFAETEDDMIRGLLQSEHPFLKGITFERLEREHSVRLNIGQPFQPFANGGFGGPQGKCELKAEGLDYTPPVESRLGSAATSAYPLELISSKNDDSMNSTFGHRDAVDHDTAELWMHSSDAAARKIANGDQVRVFNDRAALVLRASVNGSVREGVVRAPSVRWPKRSPNRVGVNALISERLTDKGGGPTFFSCLVQVERCGD